MPANMLHSGSENIRTFQQVTEFTTPIQRDIVRQGVLLTRPSFALVFGEHPSQSVTDYWFPGATIANTMSHLWHPLCWRLRWITREQRDAIVRSISRVLCQLMGVAYIDPADLSAARLDSVLWHRTEAITRVITVTTSGLERFLNFFEGVLPSLEQSLQASFWNDGIPTWLVETFRSASPQQIGSFHQTINAAHHQENQRVLFSFGVWRCTNCDRVRVGLYGAPCAICHNSNVNDAHYRNLPSGELVIIRGWCTQDGCGGYGLMGQRCSECQTSVFSMKNPSPSPGFDDSNPRRFWCRKFNRINGNYVGGFNTALGLYMDVYSVCLTLPQTSLPPSLCRRNDPRNGLLSNGGQNSSLKKKIRIVLFNNDSLVVGQYLYTRVSPNDNSQYIE